MRYNTLGTTDLKISELCLGSMTWGTQNTTAEGHAQIDMALDYGVNIIDTAEMYPVNPLTKEILQTVVASTLTTLDNAETTVNSVLGEVGARLNTPESSRDLHLDNDLLNREVLSDIENLDYAEAATRLSLQTFILQAAQQSFVRVSGLSLFKFL